MIGVDITLSSTAQNDSFIRVPFLDEMRLRGSSIIVLKEWLSAFENNGWLDNANQKVLDTMMSWKNDGTGSKY